MNDNKNTVEIKKGKFDLVFDADKVSNVENLNKPQNKQEIVTENIKVEILDNPTQEDKISNMETDEEPKKKVSIFGIVMAFILGFLLYLGFNALFPNNPIDTWIGNILKNS